ncbi:phage holin family protein [Cellulosimicrobium sp. PMB13]|uniref:phage holin family protein n=1 Tax=Cellulosimicrobium sp. PMB13 TaxID=3120158 RepID=UPI003F4C1163
MSSAPDPFAAANTSRHAATTGPDLGTGGPGLGAGAVPGTEPLRTPEQQSVGELVAEVSRDLSTLMRQEVELAKAEAKQSAQRAGKGAGMLAGAGVAGHMILLFLSIALWWALGAVMGRGWSALVVAVLWAVVAAILAAMGRKELKTVEGMPETADTIKKIPNAVRGHEEKNS